MKLSVLSIKLLLAALALGTAWAVRGQFGHEHGAAWAGGIGVLTILVLGQRQDWYKRMGVIVALGAIGWGVGGMMSYGRVVGYGKSLDMINVSYGLLSLFLIGGLYGFIGGGFTGLALASTQKKKVSWANLLTQMIAGAYLAWGILVYQFEWLMTPPRSELWAACLGAALALGWYAYRNQYHSSLRVALFSGLGAGFGFAFGNFLQVMGSSSGIAFNWWNVMEYTLGFFGGLGMAYGVYTEKWPASDIKDDLANTLGWIFIIIILPFTNLVQAFSYDKLLSRAQNLQLADPQSLIMSQYIIIWASLIVIGGFLFIYNRKRIRGERDWSNLDGLIVCVLYLGWYILLSNVMGANWLNGGDLKEFLYWINLIVIGFGISYSFGLSEENIYHASSYRLWLRMGSSVFVIIFILSLILVNSHADLPGAQTRFVIWE